MLLNRQKRFLSSKKSFWTDRNTFQKNFFPMVPPLVLWSPLKLFFYKFWKFLIRLQIGLKPSKTFSFIKTNILNSLKHVSKKFFSNGPSFGPMVTPLTLFRLILKIFSQVSNCFKTIKNVFFHQNNHFELIETRFQKIFFQWSPLWSYGHSLNCFRQILKIFN